MSIKTTAYTTLKEKLRLQVLLNISVTYAGQSLHG